MQFKFFLSSLRFLFRVLKTLKQPLVFMWVCILRAIIALIFLWSKLLPRSSKGGRFGG